MTSRKVLNAAIFALGSILGGIALLYAWVFTRKTRADEVVAIAARVDSAELKRRPIRLQRRSGKDMGVQPEAEAAELAELSRAMFKASQEYRAAGGYRIFEYFDTYAGRAEKFRRSTGRNAGEATGAMPSNWQGGDSEMGPSIDSPDELQRTGAELADRAREFVDAVVERELLESWTPSSFQTSIFCMLGGKRDGALVAACRLMAAYRKARFPLPGREAVRPFAAMLDAATEDPISFSDEELAQAQDILASGVWTGARRDEMRAQLAASLLAKLSVRDPQFVFSYDNTLHFLFDGRIESGVQTILSPFYRHATEQYIESIAFGSTDDILAGAARLHSVGKLCNLYSASGFEREIADANLEADAYYLSLIVDFALLRSYRRFGRWPESAGDLLPEFLPAEFAGSELQWDWLVGDGRRPEIGVRDLAYFGPPSDKLDIVFRRLPRRWAKTMAAFADE